MKVILWLRHLVQIKFVGICEVGVLVKCFLEALTGHMQTRHWQMCHLFVQLNAIHVLIAIIIFGFRIVDAAHNRNAPLQWMDMTLLQVIFVKMTKVVPKKFADRLIECSFLRANHFSFELQISER